MIANPPETDPRLQQEATIRRDNLYGDSLPADTDLLPFTVEELAEIEEEASLIEIATTHYPRSGTEVMEVELHDVMSNDDDHPLGGILRLRDSGKLAVWFFAKRIVPVESLIEATRIITRGLSDELRPTYLAMNAQYPASDAEDAPLNK